MSRLWLSAYCFWLLAMTGNIHAGPVLSNSTPIGFFTNCADHLLRSQLNLSVTNIPVYDGTNFVYSPAVHRLLQLAANIYDASTNRPFEPGSTNFYPSVFRPRFGVNGKNIFIAGFVEEENNATSYTVSPLSLPEDAAVIAHSPGLATNIYGVPWIIGAKKGLPNFNEFTLQTVSQITRKLELRKPSLGAPQNTWLTNQMYVVGISNAIGMQAWNSYSSNYNRSVQLIMLDNIAVSLTNEFGLQVTTNIILGTNYIIPANQWAGFTRAQALISQPCFQAFLSNMVFLPESIYRQISPVHFDSSSSGFEQNSGFPLPHFVLGVTNRLRFIMRDLNTGRIIDYLHLNGLNSVRKLTEETSSDFGVAGVWDTNRYGGTTESAPLNGIVNQIQASLGNIPVSLSSWNNAQLQTSTSQSKTLQIQSFAAFYNGSDTTNIAKQVPFAPARKVVQQLTWSANDPLVHYTLNDLTDLIAGNSLAFVVPPSSFVDSYPTNTTRLPARYAPWGGNPIKFTGSINTDPAYKDPMVRGSDDWDFPSDALTNPSSLGRVHRGTPWQTVYLKSSLVDSNQWESWTGNLYQDALHTRPSNDWHIVSLLISLLNTNPLTAQLSLNQTNLNLAFGNGINVLTNVTANPNKFVTPELSSLLMDSSSAQAGAIANGINVTRSSQPGQYFLDVGDILATPELSINSPWLDLTGSQPQYGLTDIAYEIIPSQLLPLLRPDAIVSITRTNGQLQLQFTGFDGHAYSVETSTDLQAWIPAITSYPSNGVFFFNNLAVNSTARYYRSVMLP